MRRAFSLIEMAVVIGFVGIIAAYILKVTHTGKVGTCYVDTKVQLERAKEAIERFAMSNDRFPRPALRQVGVESPQYGREVEDTPLELAKIDQWVVDAPTDKVAYFGAFPFQTLGLPVEYAVDCWGNKLSYVVTKKLTTTSDFLEPSTDGAMEVRSSGNAANVLLAGAGYAIISHGADELGAVKNNFNDAAANTWQKRKWCPASASATEIRSQNCDVTNEVLVAAPFNDGKNAGDNFFDDVIVYRGKPWRQAQENECECPPGAAPWKNLFTVSPTGPTCDPND